MMNQLEFGSTVLAAVDLGGDWSNVVAHGLDFAKRTGARLHLVHVLEPISSPIQRALADKEIAAYGVTMKRQAEARMAEILTSMPKDVKVTSTLCSGKPVAEILDEAKRSKAGLIVCGAGVTEGTEWLVVRTTPDRLLRTSSVPILVVGPETAHRFKRILVPTDTTAADLGALRVAHRLAAADGARVSVLHVYAVPSVMHRYAGGVTALRREVKKSVTKHLSDFVTQAALPAGGRPVHQLLRQCIDSTDVAEGITIDAARLRMDLIVMALGSVTLLRRYLLGSVAEKVIRRLPCSFLALPTAWAEKR